MAYVVELSREAETEVMEIFVWKGDRSMERASLWYNGLMGALTSLEEHPSVARWPPKALPSRKKFASCSTARAGTCTASYSPCAA